MKKNLVLLFTLVAVSGSISAMQQFTEKQYKELQEKMDACHKQEDVINKRMFSFCNTLKNEQEKTECKDTLHIMLREDLWKLNRCNIVADALHEYWKSKRYERDDE